MREEIIMVEIIFHQLDHMNIGDGFVSKREREKVREMGFIFGSLFLFF